jgi:NifU-like protein involved in Fe-S cluster formation
VGTWIVVETEIGDATIRRIAFRAFACPHLIAACSRATEMLLGGPAAGLARFDVHGLAAELALPAGKLGRLLVLEDALRNCWTDWDTTQPAGHP